MQLNSSVVRNETLPHTASWSAVLALTLAAFTLVAAEFMPVSLLTPIAAELNVTEGMAGQSIAVSGAFALLTSLFISSASQRVDRRLLLLSLTTLLIVSSGIAAGSSNFWVFMVARAFVGAAIGGFWSMSAATAMRLVPDHQVPKALAILNGGNALALVIAAPLGSFLGNIIGWRGAFFALAPIGLIAFLWLLKTLPSMAPVTSSEGGGILRVLNKPGVIFGMIGVALLFAGQFSLYTYVRPFLEQVVGVQLTTLSLILLMIGTTGFVGTALIGFLLNSYLYTTLITIPILMAGLALGLIFFSGSLAVVVVLLAFWGFFATSAPVGWWTWIARTVPNDAEAGGGIMVAVIQLAITTGATLGGFLFDHSGFQATFTLSVALLLVASLLSVGAAKMR